MWLGERWTRASKTRPPNWAKTASAMASLAATGWLNSMMVSRVTETPLSPFLGLVLLMGDGGVAVAVRVGSASDVETWRGGGVGTTVEVGPGSGAETGGGVGVGNGVGVGPPRVRTTAVIAAIATIRTSRPGTKYRREVFVISAWIPLQRL